MLEVMFLGWLGNTAVSPPEELQVVNGEERLSISAETAVPVTQTVSFR